MNFGHINYFFGGAVGILGGKQGVQGILDFLGTCTADMTKEIDFFSGIGKGLKWTGRIATSVGFLYSLHLHSEGKISDFKLGTDGIVSVATLFPGAGVFVGGQYFLIDNTIGVDNFNNMIINNAMQRINMINEGNYGMIFYPRFGQSVR